MIWNEDENRFSFKLLASCLLATGWAKFICEIFCTDLSSHRLIIYFKICAYNSNSLWFSFYFFPYQYIGTSFAFFLLCPIIVLLNVRFYIFISGPHCAGSCGHYPGGFQTFYWLVSAVDLWFFPFSSATFHLKCWLCEKADKFFYLFVTLWIGRTSIQPLV